MQPTNCFQVILMLQFLNFPFYAFFILLQVVVAMKHSIEEGLVVLMCVVDLVSVIATASLLPVTFRRLDQHIKFIASFLSINIVLEVVFVVLSSSVPLMSGIAVALLLHDLAQALLFFYFYRRMQGYTTKQWKKLFKNVRRYKL